jgi:hypothetical protein
MILCIVTDAKLSPSDGSGFSKVIAAGRENPHALEISEEWLVVRSLFTDLYD